MNSLFNKGDIIFSTWSEYEILDVRPLPKPNLTTGSVPFNYSRFSYNVKIIKGSIRNIHEIIDAVPENMIKNFNIKRVNKADHKHPLTSIFK
jgi:hypothetical protein